MEFATEMIIRASLKNAKIAEIPITLHPDGRRTHPPHLKTFRDGFRTLRFYLIYSPRWLFLLPVPPEEGRASELITTLFWLTAAWLPSRFDTRVTQPGNFPRIQR